jgi:SNF2 family DNA or RNA helicase
MALACLALEDDQVDIVVLVCEANKLVDDEWPATIEKFTTLDWKLYHGSIKKREKIRADLPKLLLTSFDTLKRDAAIFPANKRSKSPPTPGPLLEVLADKRVLVIFDETTRISNRGSSNHKGASLFVNTLRHGKGCKVLAMTATPMERDPGSMYDLGRILIPEKVGPVSAFEHQYVKAWDIFRKPFTFKNLSRSDWEDPDVVPFSDLFEDIILRKRKSDPDVVNFFPKRREMPPTFVQMGKQHQQFYDVVKEIALSVPEFEQRQYVTVLRQIAAHPMSLTLSEGDVAKAIVDHVTPMGLAAMGSAKTDRMGEWLREVVTEQGAQCVVFTQFAHTVLPLLQASCEALGFSVSVNHGGLSLQARSSAQRAFRAGETQIFLTSDAGAKGINLPEATYLLHYERPSTHANLVQRSDRIHRIDSLAEAVFIYSLVARDTIEEGLYNLNLRRNGWSDKLLGDDVSGDAEFITADDRKQLLKIGRQHHD